MFFLAIIEGRTARDEEDLRLLRSITSKDQGALGRLYDRYASLVYTFVLRIVKSADEAEDLLQEIFLQIWNKAALFSDSKGSVYTWVMTIARRKAIDHLRSRNPAAGGVTIDDEGALGLADVTYLASPLHATISAEYESIMKRGLATLSGDQRTVIEMSYYEGYTQAEIAERTGVPLGTVKTRMRQGLMKLRTYLKESMQP